MRELERRAAKRARERKYAGIPSYRTMVRRLNALLASASDEQWDAGMGWYPTFAGVADILAERHSVTFDQAAGVLAILSPRTSVATSVIVADRVLGAWHESGDASARMVPGVIGENVDRAVDFLAGRRYAVDMDQGRTLTEARKVRSFYRNVTGDPDPVTVDTWALAAVGSDRDVVRGGAYVAVAEAYRTVARRHGITPRECQAVAWCAVRTDVDAAEELWTLAELLRTSPVAAAPVVPVDRSEGVPV